MQNIHACRSVFDAKSKFLARFCEALTHPEMTEDCRMYPSGYHCYGHREGQSNQEGDEYTLPNRAEGCAYSSTDYPGYGPLEPFDKFFQAFPEYTVRLEFAIRFLHNIIDTCQNPPTIVRSELREYSCSTDFKGDLTKPTNEKTYPDTIKASYRVDSPRESIPGGDPVQRACF